MVAGSLRNPWADPGGRMEFGDQYWCPGTGEDGWIEQEYCVGEKGGFHEGFAGKDRASFAADDAGEYLYVEDLPASAPRRPMGRMKEDKVSGSPGNPGIKTALLKDAVPVRLA